MPQSDAEILEKLTSAAAAVAGDRVAGVTVKDACATIVLNVADMNEVARGEMETALKNGVRAQDGIRKVRVAMTSEKRRRRIIAIGSGKGGVGKSTFSANLAVAMQRMGRKVGLVDADIYGPSQPRLLSCEGVKPEARDSKMVPVPTGYGVPVLSMGHLVAPGQAIAWRGPMATRALAQLIDAHWGDVTDLIVDLPPGTGDVQMSMMQTHTPDGALIVSTPQDLALMDAVRAINLFEQGKIPVIGIAENMAGYVCPHCGDISDPFGSGGAEAAANELGLPFLGRVPLDISIRKASDAGTPLAAGEGLISKAFAAIAGRVMEWTDSRQTAR